MTRITRTERYEANACMDREDAHALADHMTALAQAMSANGGSVDLAKCDHETGLHYARLVRVLQRATQPNVVPQAACGGVHRIVLLVVDGIRTFTVHATQADIVLELDKRRMRLEPPTNNVVQIDLPEQQRRRA